MAKRKRILMDVDGPLTSGFFEAICEYLRTHGIDAHPTKIDRWDIFEAFGVNDDVKLKITREVGLDGPGDYAPRPGMYALMSKLKHYADVYIVTAPYDLASTWAHEREQWLRRKYIIPYERIIHARDKKLIRGDFLVDDRVSTLVEWQAENPAGLAIKWCEPHNAKDIWDGPAVSTADELMELFERRGLFEEEETRVSP